MMLIWYLAGFLTGAAAAAFAAALMRAKRKPVGEMQQAFDAIMRF